jgi:gas vesicle protein
MKKLISLAIGFGIGAAIGAALVLLFAPASGDKLVRSLKEGYAETMEQARLASEARRRELEAELKARRTLNSSTAIQKTGDLR